MRGVILAGGRGTRLAPQTEITNKHLLPVYTPQGAIPMIWYPLNTLVQSGVKDILIISSQEHCGDIIEFLGDGKRFGVELTYKIQDHNDPTRPVGIASALKLSREFVNGRNFAVILGDNFYEHSYNKDFEDYSWRERTIAISNNSAHIFLKRVEDPERFGVATVDANNNVTKIVEKPKSPESNYAVTGLYLYSSNVFDIIKDLKPSARGELEVSDINDYYVKNGRMTSTIMNGYWSDMGIPSSMARTQEWINTNNYRIPFK